MENRPGAGVGVMVLKDNKVLLGKRHVEPEKADSELQGAGTWTMPGGKLDFGEDVKEAAKRETFEETSLKLNTLKVISVTNDIKGTKHFVTIGFLCEDFEGSPKVMEPDEITEWRWFDVNNLPEPMFFPCVKIVKNYLDKEIYKH